jgi:hypothetical protein
MADPCLLSRNDEKGIIFIGLYVDDCLCIGTKEAIDDLKKKLPLHEKHNVNFLKSVRDREFGNYASDELKSEESPDATGRVSEDVSSGHPDRHY